MIVTFYSFKGGTGRTQLCANVAAYLCFKKNKRILLWDWDFEAPGLHHYFKIKNDEINVDGTLEILEEYIKIMRSKKSVTKDMLPMITEKNIISVCESPNNGKIDLIPAGRYTESFSQRFNEFNWFEFSIMLDGIVYLDKLKQQVSSLPYDYIFIDSRTGITDYSGICNILLPDINVIIMAPNAQNFDGSDLVISSILNHEYTKRKGKNVFILPILSRVDTSFPDIEIWINKFIDQFSYLVKYFDKKIDPSFYKEVFNTVYLKETCLNYIYSISAGENIFFDTNSDYFPSVSFKSNYANISEYIETIKNKSTVNLISKLDINTLDLILNTEKKEGNARSKDFKIESKNNIEKILFEEGINLFNKGNIELSIEIFNKLIEFNHNAYDAYNELGLCYLKLDNIYKAIECFEKSIFCKPDFPNARLNLGNAYILIKNFEKALENYRKALSIKSDYFEAHYYLSKLLISKNDIHGAIENLNTMQKRMNSIKWSEDDLSKLYLIDDLDTHYWTFLKNRQEKPDFCVSQDIIIHAFPALTQI